MLVDITPPQPQQQPTAATPLDSRITAAAEGTEVLLGRSEVVAA